MFDGVNAVYLHVQLMSFRYEMCCLKERERAKKTVSILEPVSHIYIYIYILQRILQIGYSFGGKGGEGRRLKLV